MIWSNYDDVCAQIAAAGLLIDPKRGLEVGTKAFVRCKVVGDHAKRGWYKLYTAYLPHSAMLIGGSFGVYYGNDPGIQRVSWTSADRKQMTSDQVEANRARAVADRKEAEAALLRRHEIAARKAGGWWRKWASSARALTCPARGCRLAGCSVPGCRHHI